VVTDQTLRMTIYVRCKQPMLGPWVCKLQS